MSFGENGWDEYWNKQGQGFGAERVAGEKYVTEEKERNQSKRKLFKYLDKHGDSRIVKKGQSTAIQDYITLLIWAGLWNFFCRRNTDLS